MTHTDNPNERKERVAEAVELLRVSEEVFKELLQGWSPEEANFPMCKGLEETYSRGIQSCYEALAKFEGAHQIARYKLEAGRYGGIMRRYEIPRDETAPENNITKG